MSWITAWWTKTDIIWSAGYVGRELRAAVPVQCILLLFNIFGLIFYSKTTGISFWSLVETYYVFLMVLVASIVCVSVVKVWTMLYRVCVGIQYHQKNLKIGLSFIVLMVMGIYLVLLFCYPYVEIIVQCIAFCNILTILIYNLFIKSSMLYLDRTCSMILRINVILSQILIALLVLYVRIIVRGVSKEKFGEHDLIYLLLVFFFLCFLLLLYSTLAADLVLVLMGGLERPVRYGRVIQEPFTCSQCLYENPDAARNIGFIEALCVSDLMERYRLQYGEEQPQQTEHKDDIVYEVILKMPCFLAEDWKPWYYSRLEQLDSKEICGRDFFRAIPFCVLITFTRFFPLATSEFTEDFLSELVDPFQFSGTIMLVSWFAEKMIIQKMLVGNSEAELYGLYSTSLMVAHGATALTVLTTTHALIMEGPSSNSFVFSIITMSLFTVFFWFLHMREYPLALKRENPWNKLVILQRICFVLVFIYCLFSTFFGNDSFDPEFSSEYIMYLKVKGIIITGATLIYFSKIYTPISADFVLLMMGRLGDKKVELVEAPRTESAVRKNRKRHRE